MGNQSLCHFLIYVQTFSVPRTSWEVNRKCFETMCTIFKVLWPDGGKIHHAECFLFIEAELHILFWYLSCSYIHYSSIKRKLEQERKHLKCNKNSGLVTNRKLTPCSGRVHLSSGTFPNRLPGHLKMWRLKKKKALMKFRKREKLLNLLNVDFSKVFCLYISTK